MFVFLLSGLFSCLDVSGVIVFAVWAGACFIFAGARAPPKKQKKCHHRPNSKKLNTHPPLPSVLLLFFAAVWAGGRIYLFLLFGRDACFVFAVWAGDVFFLAVWACACFFAVWARGVCIFCYLGGGHDFVCCLGGGREFIHLPVCLARLQATQQQKRPNSKKKKKHRFLFRSTVRYDMVRPRPPSGEGPLCADWLNTDYM